MSWCFRHQVDGQRMCNNWQLTVDFIEDVVDYLTIGPDDTQVALLLFDSNAMLQWNLNT